MKNLAKNIFIFAFVSAVGGFDCALTRPAKLVGESEPQKTEGGLWGKVACAGLVVSSGVAAFALHKNRQLSKDLEGLQTKLEAQKKEHEKATKKHASDIEALENVLAAEMAVLRAEVGDVDALRHHLGEIGELRAQVTSQSERIEQVRRFFETDWDVWLKEKAHKINDISKKCKAEIEKRKPKDEHRWPMGEFGYNQACAENLGKVTNEFVAQHRALRAELVATRKDLAWEKFFDYSPRIEKLIAAFDNACEGVDVDLSDF